MANPNFINTINAITNDVADPIYEEEHKKKVSNPTAFNANPIIPQPIKIMIKLNTDFNSQYQEFTYDMIDHPSVKKAKNVDAKYPYFTSSCKIPYSVLLGKDYLYVLEFFFSRNKFERIMMKYQRNYVDETVMFQITETPSDEQKEILLKIDENGRYNVEVMLKLLFPIEPSLNQTFSSSFHQNILKNTNTNIFDDFVYFNLLPNTGQLKVDGQTHIISDVVWVNDIVNHPVYFNFLKKYNNAILLRKGNIGRVDVEYTNKRYEFYFILDRLYNHFTKEANPKFTMMDRNNFFTILYQKIKDETPTNTGFSSSLSNKVQSIKIIKEQLKPFNPDNTNNDKYYDFLRLQLDSSGKLSRTKISDYNQDNEIILDEIMTRVIRIYSEIKQISKTDAPITLGSDLTNWLTKIYNGAIALRAVRLIRMFVLGDIQRLDMKLENKDGSEKPKEERDIIQYISNNYSNFAKMSEDIANSVNDVIAPIRETSNLKLKLKLNELKIKPVLMTGDNDDDDNKPSDFLQDVYNYYVLRSGLKPVNKELMYTGINTVQSSYSTESKGLSGAYYEIYALIDTITKDKYDSGKNRCLLKDDDLVNQFNHVLYSKMSELVRTSYRDLPTFESANFPATGAPSENTSNPSQKMNGGNSATPLSTILKLSKQYSHNRLSSHKNKYLKPDQTNKTKRYGASHSSPTHNTNKKKHVRFDLRKTKKRII
jgi:hypothetical protein